MIAAVFLTVTAGHDVDDAETLGFSFESAEPDQHQPK
jgi:hypothetical protein